MRAEKQICKWGGVGKDVCAGRGRRSVRSVAVPSYLAK